MDTLTLGEFARLLLNTAPASDPAKTIRIAFEGSSPWLKHCEASMRDLPCLRQDGPVDIVVTDSKSGPGWYFALNGRRLSPDLREFFWHANEGPHPIELSLHSPEGIEGRLRIPPIAGFFWREQHAAAMEAAPALLMIGVVRRASRAVCAIGSPMDTKSPAEPPGPLALNWFKFKKLSRSLYLRLPGTSVKHRWHIALHADSPATIGGSGWKWTSGFAGHEAADPFLVPEQNRLWLFFEDMLPRTRHGRLAVMPAFEDGAEPTVILEKPYHLSYPCVFEHEGEWWMVPESSANSTVDLYRARQFPYEWDYVKTLMQGPRLVDTTPFLHEGRWYFFTTATLPGRAYVSLLFVAEALDAPWRLHPASPLTGDAAIARGAGRIVRRNGSLIRPVQDCLVSYGYSMTLREIVRLSPTLLEERPGEAILPSWHRGLSGTHTFSSAGPALALDGLR